MQEGFALAASARADRGAARALAGLAPAVADRALQVARELAASDRAQRRSWLSSVLATARSGGVPRADLRGVPARALALLSPSVPRELGRRWLAAAPLPRPGFVPDPELLIVLRKLAAREPR
jgi:hypothetical protein